ncbi:hAT transposon family protein [Phanerochaete sordida]|uniref:HAT transposon family protein n=1 Tax=Phanerochaete sordida TaxID=48140 RepID=A0A9P3G3Z9_9APHY|nr:hAT transposon family protein [Phanerochaete sordida]
MDLETPALNTDGTLKDARDIEWINSPSNETIELPPDPKPSPISEFNTLKRKAASGTKVAAPAAPAAPEISKGKKKPAVERRLPKSAGVSTEHMSTEATEDFTPEHIKKRRRKGDAYADVLTVFRRLEADEAGKERHECTICVERRKKNVLKFGKIQTLYAGNSTALRSHISKDMEHYTRYREGCVKDEITMDPRCMPREEKERLSGKAQANGNHPIASFLEPAPPKPEAWSIEGLEDHVCRFVVETDQALAIVDQPSFRALLSYQRPSMKESELCHRTKMTDIVIERAQLIMEELDSELQTCPGKVSLTFDGWTSKIMTAYLAITAHYITVDWTLRSELLAFSELEGSHSGENMGQELHNAVTTHELENKLGNLTADNVTVNDKAIRVLGTKLRADDDAKTAFRASEQRSHCFAHAVHLAEAAFLTALSPKKKSKGKDVPIIEAPAERLDGGTDAEETEEDVQELMKEVQDALKTLPEGSNEARLLSGLLLKVRGFITKVRRSPQAKAFFKKCCAQATGEVLELLPFCKTRWGTWHTVLGRTLILQKAITAFINQADDSDEVPNVERGQPKWSSYRLEPEEWDLMKLIYKVLDEAAIVQNHFSSETIPTVWRVLPLYESFMREWETMQCSSAMAVLRPAIECGLESLRKYYNKSENAPVNIVAMYLNPFIKDEYFMSNWTQEGQAEARQTMEKVFDRYQSAHEAALPKVSTAETSSAGVKAAAEPRARSYNSWILDATASRRQREASAARGGRSELLRYLNEPLAEASEGDISAVLEWWKKHASRFPVLAQMARDFLPVQGSSVPCERAFSSAGLTDDKRRGAILPENFGAIQTLKARYVAERKRKKEEVEAQWALTRRACSLLRREHDGRLRSENGNDELVVVHIMSHNL